MRQGKRQSIFRRFFASRLFLIISLVVVLLIALGYARAYYQDYTIKEEIRELEREVARLETKKIESLDILQYVMSEDFIEAKGRLELNLERPGEHLVIIEREDREDALPAGSGSADGEQSFSNPLKWWYYFSHTHIDSEG